jgi:hypothetical protein
MTHHHHEKKENYDKLYYTVGLLAGLFVGVVIDHGIIQIIALGIFGVLFTAFFLQVLVRGRGEA